MNNNILKIQNDLFFLFQKKNVPENRHEKRRELPDYYLKKDGIRVTEPRTGHCREKIFEREKVTERRIIERNEIIRNTRNWKNWRERRYGTADGTLPTEYVKSGKKIEERGQWEESL